jgi:hypothetical protein
MDLSGFVRPLVFLHLLSVFSFLILHGASVATAFRLRTERDRASVRAMLQLSNAYVSFLYVALLAILVTGILAGIAVGWWTSGRLWIWVALVLLFVIAGVMYPLGTAHMDTLRRAVGLPTFADRGKEVALPPEASDEELARLLMSPRPMVAAAVGLGGILVITWLMMFKPF